MTLNPCPVSPLSPSGMISLSLLESIVQLGEGGLVLVNFLNQPSDCLNWSVGVDPMSKVANVVTVPKTTDHFIRQLFQRLLWRIECTRIQVPLQYNARANYISRDLWINCPVKSNNVIPEIGYFLESIMTSFGKYNHWDRLKATLFERLSYSGHNAP